MTTELEAWFASFWKREKEVSLLAVAIGYHIVCSWEYLVMAGELYAEKTCKNPEPWM